MDHTMEIIYLNVNSCLALITCPKVFQEMFSGLFY